jgi:hypothetical protein
LGYIPAPFAGDCSTPEFETTAQKKSRSIDRLDFSPEKMTNQKFFAKRTPNSLASLLRISRM